MPPRPWSDARQRARASSRFRVPAAHRGTSASPRSASALVTGVAFRLQIASKHCRRRRARSQSVCSHRARSRAPGRPAPPMGRADGLSTRELPRLGRAPRRWRTASPRSRCPPSSGPRPAAAVGRSSHASRGLEQLADAQLRPLRGARLSTLPMSMRASASEADDRVDRCVAQLVDRVVEPVERRVRGDAGVDSNAPLADQRRNPAARPRSTAPGESDEQHVSPATLRASRDDAGPEDDARRVVLLPGVSAVIARSSAMNASLFSVGVVVGRPASVCARSRPGPRASPGPSAARRRRPASPQPVDAVDGLAPRVAAGPGDCAQSRSLRAAVGCPPTESWAPLLMTTCLQVARPAACR